MSHIYAEKFAIENDLDVDEVIDLFRAFDFRIGLADTEEEE